MKDVIKEIDELKKKDVPAKMQEIMESYTDSELHEIERKLSR